MAMNPKVDAYVRRQGKWRDAFEKLRALLIDSVLVEDMKWGHPCYTLDDKNVVLMHGFKEYCALLFHKGALMKDPKRILIQQTANVQSARQIRFTSAADVTAQAKTLKVYVREAIRVERSGAKVVRKETKDFAMPAELQKRLGADPRLKAAFAALTPGRQRGYILYLAGAKQATTRAARVEKCVPRILAGLGLND